MPSVTLAVPFHLVSKRRRTLFVAGAILLIASGCGRKHNGAATAPKTPQPSYPSARQDAGRQHPNPPAAIAVGYTEDGLASWYGIPYHGRQAADGEIYDMETLVAAHRTMPFNTWLKVTNVSNNKSVNVRVIDRGPFVDGRIIDLSKAAARQIELLGPGVGQVHLEVVAASADVPSNDFYGVQIGAFSVAANAERTRAAYAQRFGTAQIALKQGSIPVWRVLVGKESSMAAAQQLANTLSAENKDVFIVRLDQIPPSPVPPPPASAPPAQTLPQQ